MRDLQGKKWKAVAAFTLSVVLTASLIPAGTVMAAGKKNARADKPTYAVVDNEDDLLYHLSVAADEDLVICLKPGTYNLSEALRNSDLDLPYLRESGKNAPGLYKEDGYDGEYVILNGVENLTIQSIDEQASAEIVVEPRYADVFAMQKCSNITLRGLTLGHTIEKGSCQGDVIDLTDCDNITVEDCNLYGCGTYGFSLLETTNLKVSDSTIHDCSYGCVESRESDGVFYHTVFRDCEEFAMFEMSESQFRFFGCNFKRLHGSLFSLDSYSDVTLYDCLFDRDARASLVENDYYGALLNEW